MTAFQNVYGNSPWVQPTLVPITAFGGIGDGKTDNTNAFVQAFQAYNSIYIPEGNFLVNGTIVLKFGQSLTGGGQSSQITASSTSFDAIQMIQSYGYIGKLRINGGNAGIRLYGLNSPCVQNTVEDVNIWESNYGIVLDGYQNTNNPCYWNNFFRVLVIKPKTCGIWLTKSGSGDTPNSNRFHACRVYSLGVPITGDGIYIQYGADNNSFIDCEANVNASATNCINIGPNASTTLLINPYTESSGTVTNILLQAGSSGTVILSQKSASGGAAIADQSGGSYTAFNSISTSQSAHNYFASLNIGYQPTVTANTLTAPFQIHGINSNSSNLGMFIYLNNNVGTRISLNKSRSTTIGNQGAVVLNDDLGYLDYNASDNSHFLASAQVKASVDQAVTPGQGFVAGRLVFLTSPQNSGGLLEAMRVDSHQNVIHGAAAIATTATNGFTYIATCAGAPTGVPTAYTGRVPMVFDSTNSKFYIYTNGSWKGTVLS